MKPVINSLLVECRRRSTTVHQGFTGIKRGGGKRSFSSSSAKKHINENSNTTIEEAKSQSIANAISYYSASWMSSLSERFTINNEKFAKEFNRYYKGLNDALKSNRFTSTLASTTENKESNSQSSGGAIILKETQPEVLKSPPSPSSSLPQPMAQSTVPVATAGKVNNEERLAKLCTSIEKASSLLIKSKLITDLYQLFYEDTEICGTVLRSHKTLLFQLVNLRAEAERKRDKMLYGQVNQCLALIGYVDPSVIKHQNLNILSLDGGGAKGFVAIEIMKNIEKHCQKPIHEIFDYICGVSTGAVLASLVGIFKLSLSECEREYKRFLKELFQRNKVAGLSSLIGNHSYYDTKVWETMLKDAMGEMLVINSAKEKTSPKISMVSCKTTPDLMKIYLFRNYNLPQSALSQYEGTARYKVWEAVRASTAAPVYYEDFKLDGCMYQDGGILANNPTFVALHEAKQLWPSIKDNYTVVSIGNGRRPNNEFGGASGVSSPAATSAASISLRQKITRIVSGVADPESTHSMLADLLPANKYFRFCPFMSEEYGLDENRPAKWQLMQYETNMYMRRNEMKFERAAQRLLKAKTPLQRFEDFLYNENYITNV